MPEAHCESHFESMEQQAHAARLGMWVFLASEMLLFAGLFALFVTYRVEHPVGFAEGVRHNTKVLGSINTGVLLFSSYLVATSVQMVRRGSLGTAKLLILGTIVLGATFLAIKFTEYGHHFREGIYPGGAGAFFSSAATNGNRRNLLAPRGRDLDLPLAPLLSRGVRKER
jgi:cytochrome c oxidase subunit III